MGLRQFYTKEQIQELIENLQGTNQSLESGCAKVGLRYPLLTFSDLGLINTQIFQCDCCGWWYDKGDESCYYDQCRFCVDTEENHDSEEYFDLD